jgi:hypothetical protein
MSKHLLYNAKNFKEFSPNAMYKITCIIKVPTTAINRSLVTLRIGVIGSTDEYGQDLVIKNGAYTLQDAYNDCGYHCFNGTLNDSTIIQDEYVTLTGYTSNIYGSINSGIILGSNTAGSLASPGTLYTNAVPEALSTKYITPVIYIDNNAGSNVSIIFDSLTLEEVTTSISANGITTGIIKAAQIGVGTNNILLDAEEEAIIISSPVTGEMIRIGKLSPSEEYGIKIKNAIGQNVLWVDDTGIAQISNILMGSAGSITWDPSVFAPGTGALGNYLTKLDATGLYTGKIFAEQISGGEITVGLGIGTSGLIKSLSYSQNLAGWMIAGDGKFQFNKDANNYLRYDGTTFRIAGDIQMSETSQIYWSNVATGGNRPSDNATVGAPAGTYVGGTLAQTVEANAATAITAINNMASDNKLSPSEKQALLLEWNVILSTYDKLVSHASTIGYTSAALTSYTASINTLGTYINAGTSWNITLRPTPSWLTNLSVDTDIVGNTFRTNFKDYYAAEEVLRSALTYKPIWIDGTAIAAGKSSLVDTTNGFYLGTSGTTGVMNIGSSTKYIKWDGTNLYINGNIDMTGVAVDWNQISNNSGTRPSNNADKTSTVLSTANITINGTNGLLLPANGYIKTANKALDGTGNGLVYGVNALGKTIFGIGNGGVGAITPHIHWDEATGVLDISGNIKMSATSTIDWSTNVTGKPTTLSAISPTEATKLSGIATGATVGATVGSNLYSSPGVLATFPTVPAYITATKITQTTIESPTITAGTVTGATITGGTVRTTSGRLILTGDTLTVTDLSGIVRVKLGLI